MDVWLIVPPEAVKAAALEVQRSFEHLGWIEPAPPHFLHVSLAHDVGRIPEQGAPFEIAYRRVNCFHEAVIAEVHGTGPGVLAGQLGATGPYLPHLTLGYVREPRPPRELRTALAPLRSADLGVQRVDEVLLCRAPASRTTLLEPWRVLQRVPQTARL